MNFFSPEETRPQPREWLAFTGNVIDPLSEKRSDDAVQIALENEATRILLIGEGKVCIRTDGVEPNALFKPQGAQALGMNLDEAILLGNGPDGPVLAVPMRPAEVPVVSGIEVVDLRSTYSNNLLTSEIVGALAQGAALLSWNNTHRFCGRCGGQNEMRAGGYRRVCQSCGAEHFPRTDPVAIMLAVKDDRCLLGRSARFAPGMYSCLAGFIEPGETIESAVRRETFEESGIRIGTVRYIASQPWPFPFSLMIGCIAEAISDEIDPDATELEDCRWFSRAEVRQMLDGTHPDGLWAATKGAIARQLVALWADSEWP
ncbi:NADH pyrophosphatase [Nitratireductor aestuarii]|uniref:NAD(+) diphosphatase n=1 Tax=Nitratireductor aestuarii TaxID=1735103 RepID=A0A916RKG4_9HYPH|nr:NAD(+) diphosphatase [Nitratireductor aestuarii]GGA59450.1 NADH pyrophosphatase [Nitratireductor aestuarii]